MKTGCGSWSGIVRRDFAWRGSAGVALALALPLAGLTGCDEQDVQEIQEVRQAARPRARVPGETTDPVRFGQQRPAAEHDHGESAVRFDLPEGWVELTPTQMRLVHVGVEARPEIECYLSILPGAAGGVLANVNRWRGQMGLDPVDEASVAGLSTAKLLGRDGAFVDLEGAYRGMGGEARDGWRMAGVIAESGGMTAFLKMTGPSDDVAAELENLRAFSASLRVEETPAPAATETAPGSSGGVSFAAPKGWVQGAERPMRVVTFHPAGNMEAECYVATLGGDGGGLLANLNRWRSQLGAGPLSQAEVDALPKAKVFGADCPVVEVEGDYTGMSGEPRHDFALLGTARLLPQAAIFVKLIGPRDVVAAERERFLAFCASLSF